MVYVGILGFGVVGSGVAEVISMNAEKISGHLKDELSVKRILDIRDFPDSPYAELMTKNAEEFFSDKDISVVVETIGGVGVAFEFTKRALSLGQTVVTSNKELVATHGVELMKMANDNGCAYLFEAAVGGGIPIIRPLHRCLAANRIMRIAGIVNGTTNYVLSQMARTETTFEYALSRAQIQGYAENDPSADIDGIDAQRKIAIMASIALNGRYVCPDDIYTQGIRDVGLEDIAYAKALQAKIKLLAVFDNIDDRTAQIIVAPYLVDNEDPLCVAEGVNNAILVSGNIVGDSMFYGQGAGKMATASAVVGDVLDGVLHKGRNPHITSWFKSDTPVVVPFNKMKVQVLVRVKGDYDAMRYSEVFGGSQVKPILNVLENETAFVVGHDGKLTEEQLKEARSKIPELLSVMRIYGQV